MYHLIIFFTKETDKETLQMSLLGAKFSLDLDKDYVRLRYI